MCQVNYDWPDSVLLFAGSTGILCAHVTTGVEFRWHLVPQLIVVVESFPKNSLSKLALLARFRNEVQEAVRDQKCVTLSRARLYLQ